MKTILFFTIYVAIWITNAGFINGDFRAQFPDLYEDKYEARNALIFSIGWSAIPVIPWIITGFISKGYTGPWSLDDSPFPCTRDPDIWCKGNKPVK